MKPEMEAADSLPGCLPMSKKAITWSLHHIVDGDDVSSKPNILLRSVSAAQRYGVSSACMNCAYVATATTGSQDTGCIVTS
eukprot:scaffold161285_cov39-Prasinocladus_malaysianus.AAC.2